MCASNGGLSSKNVYIVVGGIVFIVALVAGYTSLVRMFGSDSSVAVVTGAIVALVYLGSSIVSRLALYNKLRRYNINHPQLNPKSWCVLVVRPISFSVVVGALTGITYYFTPHNVDYSHIAFVTMIGIISATPGVAVLFSWLDAR